jgi:N-acyl-D-aspartate/D-glutamate deacylase
VHHPRQLTGADDSDNRQSGPGIHGPDNNGASTLAAPTLAARAAAMGVDPKELILDELLRNEGHAILYAPAAPLIEEYVKRARDAFDTPGALFGLGDGGAHYGLICDAAYPTYMLSEYVRDNRRMTIEQAVSMLSRETAETVNLCDRGVIKSGYKADLNVIELDRLHLCAPLVKHDLPAGGKRLSQQSDGYEATIVSGEITYRRGRPTGQLPGRLVRFGRPAPAAGVKPAVTEQA